MESHTSHLKKWCMCSILGEEKEILLQLTQLLQFDERQEDMITSVAEACINAVEHGNHFMPDKQVIVSLTITENRYVFRIYDEGTGIRQHHEITPQDHWNHDNPRGWGMYMISNLADHVRWGHENNQFYIEIIFNKQVKRKEHQQ
jgi:serine/threonine-protein kinase RsbW